MLNLNLLSKEDAKNVKFEEWRRLTIFIFLASVLVILFFVVILLPVYFSVFVEKKSVSDELKKFENSAPAADIKSVETKIVSLNRFFKEIIQRGEPKWQISGLIDLLIADTDSKILFSSISYRKDKEIYITGFAPTRRDLIFFEKKLRAYEILKEVSSPVSNLIKEANITFSIRAIPTF